MGEEHNGGLPHRAFATVVVGVVGVALLQSVVHLAVVLGAHDLHSIFDLDRSNGPPDVLSTFVLIGATAGAAALARREHGARRLPPAAVAGVLAALALADLLHDGAHPSSTVGRVVIGLVATAAALGALIAFDSSGRAQATLALGACLLAGSFLVSGLDELDVWFERERGDRVAEFEIAAKEGLELIGWSLAALALWDEALRGRGIGERARRGWAKEMPGTEVGRG